MTAREYLGQLKRIRLQVSRLTEDVLRMRARLESTTIPLRTDKVQSSGSGDKFADAIVRMADKELQCRDLIDDYEFLGRKIEAQIQSLDDPVHVAILTGVYVNGWHLTRVCGVINYSYAHTKRLHAKALDAFEEKYHELLQG